MKKARPVARSVARPIAPNRLFYGDNLNSLAKLESESVDLCYIDPPFNSKRNYNQIYNNLGKEDQAQAQAFIDTWTWDASAEASLESILKAENDLIPTRTVELITGLENVLGRGSLLSYLVSITERVAQIHRVLKSTGSFYLHCDPTASHYLKIIVDSIFCSRKGIFQNEIIWRRTGSHNTRRSFGPIHDVILFYTKSSVYYFKVLRRPYMLGHVEGRYTKDDHGLKFSSGGNILTGAGATAKGDSGKVWRGFNPTAKNRHWALPGFLTEDLGAEFHEMPLLQRLEALYKMGLIDIEEGNEWPTPVRYLKAGDGQPLQDIWACQPYTQGTVYGTKRSIDDDVRWLGTTDPERLGYPTQKPAGLMARIIEASSREGETVLDAYCGCGTTITVAQRLKRRWIGMDITYQSISLILQRLEEEHGKRIFDDIELGGVPADFKSAEALAHKKEDKVRKEFEKWIILTYSKNRARINETKGGDQGIDGKGYILDLDAKNKQIRLPMIFSAKSDKKLSPAHVREVNGTIGREKAAVGFILTLYPMPNLVAEAKKYGTYRNKMLGQDHPKILVVSAQEVLDGACLRLPTAMAVVKSSSRVHEGAEQSELGFDSGPKERFAEEDDGSEDE